MNGKFRSILMGSAGNLLEWYDFGLFSAFSLVFTKVFFPHTDPHVALVEVLGIYALGFLCRPLGALLFGYLGDRFGRVKTLRIALSTMALPTLLIAFVPTYQSIGIYAPLILVLLRLLQGISLGGEFTGIIIYLTESAPPKNRALFASLAGTLANVGFLLANGIVLLLDNIMSPDVLTSYGWRLAFILGALLGWFVVYLQRKLNETSAFTHLQHIHKISKAPVVTVLKQAKRKMLLTLSLVILDAVFYYTCFVYMNNLLQQLGMSKNFVFMSQSIALAAMLLLVPLGGFVCDRIGRRKSFLFISGSLILLTWPCFKALASGNLFLIVLALAIFTLLSSFEQGTTSATVVEQFPANIRYTGVSLSYNVTQALFGGTAPMLAAWFTLVTHNPLFPANYLTLIAVITFCSSLFFLKDTRNVNLDK